MHVAKRGRRPRNLVLKKMVIQVEVEDKFSNAFCIGDRVLLENRPSLRLFERN